jgi:diguanylate cyclase (GGDEF)-like protein
MDESTGDSSKVLKVRGFGVFGSHHLKEHSAWMAVAAIIFVAGTLGSILAGTAVAHNDGQKSHQAFASSSSDIGSTLQLAIQHEQDLIVSARGFIAGNPRASNEQFVQWANSVDALGRYPELVGIGNAVIVTAADLPAFAAQAVRDPTGPLAANGTFEVVPPGSRPYYCLTTGGLQRRGQTAFPAGTDYCPPGPVGSATLATRDSGKGVYLPIRAPKTTLLSILTPVYQGGTVPSTEAERQSTFVGWVGMGVVPQVLLARALEGHPNTAVTLRYHAGTSNVEFRSGRAPSGAQLLAINLHNGWTVTTFGAATAGGILQNRSALAVMLAGALLSLLLGTLLFVLATGRARALRVISRQTSELRHQALHDGLTGLPNRALIMDRIEQLLARNRRQGTAGAALYVDLDEFKNVNDSLGHEAGDRLLVAVASRLQSTLRDADTIGRMGGDEFVVLIDGAPLQATPEMVADRLLEVMRQPFELEGATMPLIVNTSIGIASGDRASPGDLLRDADVALYQAKAAGKNRYEIFHAEMQTDIQNRIELEFDLRSAPEGDQFHLVYQPIYNLDDLTMVGVEALVRWDHPTRGIVGPDEFIPILEQTGQIRAVGRWVLRQACRQMADWHSRGNALDISVNVSERQLDDDTIVEYISQALAESGLPATSLVIEVTETALMRNADHAAKRLRSIKELGVRIAVDDFGTGYSSLAYLQRFPIDCIKIDQGFTNAVMASPESKALIGTLVQLGKDLGLTTLAEGVETSSQMDHLRGEHINEAQGFLLSRPLDALTLETELLIPARMVQAVGVSDGGQNLKSVR